MEDSPAWLAQGLPNVWLPYAQMRTAAPPLPVVSAEGVRLRLADGRELIDGISSWWTACHGHGHPYIRAAVAQQLQRLAHVMFGGLAHEPAFRLASRLAQALPGDLDHVFFSESGSVSVEVALKMALQYWRNRGDASRNVFLSFRGGYHGDTFEAMAVTDPAVGMHDTWRANLHSHLFAELPQDTAAQESLGALLAAEAHRVAAAIVEPLVQGAGGMLMHDAHTLRRIREVCDRHGVLLIADEIMTGFGRTGRLFACEEAQVVPDILCLSKALTGGTLPLAATVARRHVFEAFLDEDFSKAFMHGPTFMGNALACAAANASLDLFEHEPRLEQVAAIERQLRAELAPCRDLPTVTDVRVKGAIGVVELARGTNAAALRPHFVRRGVWLRPFGNIVYIMPPFVISSDELGALTGAVFEVLREHGGSATQDPGTDVV